jgi:hypothetical protein
MHLPEQNGDNWFYSRFAGVHPPRSELPLLILLLLLCLGLRVLLLGFLASWLASWFLFSLSFLQQYG